MTLLETVWYTFAVHNKEALEITTSPNWVDLIIVTLILRTCYSGLSRGFLAELFHLLGIVGATVLACKFHGLLTRGLAPWVPLIEPTVLDFVSFLALLTLSAFLLLRVVVVRLVTHVTWDRLHWTVRGLGVLVGGIRGLWWSGLGLWMLLATGMPYVTHSVTQRSLFSPKLLTVAQQSLTWVVDRTPGPGRHEVLIPSLTPRLR